MPVVTTMTIIALLRGGGDGDGPFFDPEQMRDLLRDGLEGVADDELQRSLVIEDELESAMQRYRVSVSSSMDAYIEVSSNPDTDATDLTKRLASLDRERTDIMMAIIDSRRRLIEVLDGEHWDKIFG